MTKAALLSGGMDSAALLYLCKPSVAIFIDYGQSAAGAERQAAQVISRCANVPFEIISSNCADVGAGIMSCAPNIPDAPEEFWPFRNQLLITLAAGWCLKNSLANLIIGCVKTDSLHRDGSKDFIDAMNYLLSIQEGKIHLEAPALELTSSELIRKSEIPKEVVAWCHSCLQSNIPCQNCSSCSKHRDVLHELGWRHF